MNKAELNGKIYIWTGSEWLDEKYIRPPRAIVQQLETRFSHVMAEPAAAPAASRARLRPQDRDTILNELSAVIANLVDWFSSHFTSELFEHVELFERQKIDNKWAYRPAGGRLEQ